MNEQIAALNEQQRRVSEELGAMRTMHTELMRAVVELCGKMDVYRVQYESTMTAQSTMQADIKAHGREIQQLQINQASNQFFVDLVRNINRYVIMTAVSAAGSVGIGIYVSMKGVAG